MSLVTHTDSVVEVQMKRIKKIKYCSFNLSKARSPWNLQWIKFVGHKVYPFGLEVFPFTRDPSEHRYL